MLYKKDGLFLNYENNLPKDEEAITIFHYLIGQMNSCERNEDSIKQYNKISFLRCNSSVQKFRPTDYLTVSIRP